MAVNLSPAFRQQASDVLFSSSGWRRNGMLLSGLL